MSEAFIRRLAAQVVRHPTFTTAVESAVVEVLTTTLRSEFSGTELRLYVPRVGTEERARRAREIRALWNGANLAFLAAKYGLSERQVRRIVGVKPSAKVTSSG